MKIVQIFEILNFMKKINLFGIIQIGQEFMEMSEIEDLMLKFPRKADLHDYL